MRLPLWSKTPMGNTDRRGALCIYAAYFPVKVETKGALTHHHKGGKVRWLRPEENHIMK